MGAAGILDAVDVVNVPAKVVEDPAEEVLVLETGPPSSLSVLKLAQNESKHHSFF